MPTNYNAIYDTLGQISNTLGELKKQGTEIPKTDLKNLSNALNSTSSAVSSEQARREVQTAQNTSGVTNAPGQVDPMFKALQEKAQAEAKAKEAEAAKKQAEATASIADQRLAKESTKTTKTGETQSADASRLRFDEILLAEPELADYGLTEDATQDPMVVATLRNQIATQRQIAQSVAVLNDFARLKEKRVQEQVALIDQSIANQEAQLKVEQRKRMAAVKMAGILSGRLLYSPEEHQGLIQQVVQDGIVALQKVQLEGYKMKNEMYDDLDNFRYDAYVKKSELVKEYNKLELDTVTAIQERLQQVAEQERQKITFDQAQADRAALIFAEELVNASDAEIRRVALENGIDYGLLLRAVNDAKFTTQDRALTLASKRASFEKAGKKEVKPMTALERNRLVEEYGFQKGQLQIPIGWSEEDFSGFLDKYNISEKDSTIVNKMLKEYESIIAGTYKYYSERDDAGKKKLADEAFEELKKRLEAVKDEDVALLDQLGVDRRFLDSRKTEKEKLLESAQVKEKVVGYLEQGYAPMSVVEILMGTSLK